MWTAIEMWYLMELVKLYSGLIFNFMVLIVLPAVISLWFLDELLKFRRKVERFKEVYRKLEES